MVIPDITLNIHNISQSTSVISPVWVKYRKFASLYIFLTSPIYNIIVLNTWKLEIGIIFISTIKHNLENVEEGKPIVFTHNLTVFFLPSWCSKIPSFIVFFLLRKYPLAVLSKQICWILFSSGCFQDLIWIHTFMSHHIWEVIDYYFFGCFCSLTLFLLPFWNSNDMNVRPLLYSPSSLSLCFFFFQTISSLLFRLGHFNFFYFQFTGFPLSLPVLLVSLSQSFLFSYFKF